MDVLYIALNDADPQTLARWWLCEDSQVSASGTGSLSDVEAQALESAKTPARVETVVLLPDREILYIQVEIPGRSQARIRQAAPFAVEPHVTEEIDDVHIAVGDVKQRGAIPCMVMNKARLETYLSVLEQTNLQPNVVTTPGMLTDTSSELFLIESGSTITLRTPDQLAVVASDALSSTLAFTIPREEENVSITCIGSEGVASVTESVVDQLKVDDATIELITFETLLEGVSETTGLLNLLQGTYATKDGGVAIRQNLNKTVMVAAVCVVVAAVIFVIQGLWADFQTDRLREESLDIYETVYNTRDVTGNPVFRMQERMGARVDQQSKWLGLLESVVASTAGVEVRNLNFNESQNKMGITFFSDSFQQFESIRSRIENRGMNVEVNVAEQQANRVWARITLSMP